MPFLGPLALTACTGGLLALPLAPAVRELISKRDARPLVTRKDDGRVSNFADSFRSRCESIQSTLHQAGRSQATGLLECSGTKLFVSAHPGPWTGPNHIDVLVICREHSQLPRGFVSTENFFARHGVHAGEASLFRALFGDEEIVLGDGSRVLRWVHAESKLIVGKNSCLFGRASSSHSITLAVGCKFERMHAPAIYTSSDAVATAVRTDASPFSKLARAGIGRVRFQGKTRLAAGQQHRGELVVTKALVMEDDSSVLGSVKANAEVLIGRRAEIDGSLVSTKAIRIAPGTFINGPLISEHEIHIGSNVQIGLPDAPTTVSAPRIHLSPGSVIFGTVWARAEGRVEV
ncbi:MAG TPA: hypothetical protein VG498_02930 [Terriglobales bacterium]|nr:hypothetical protein [Terriglobales bacterium]